MKLLRPLSRQAGFSLTSWENPWLPGTLRICDCSRQQAAQAGAYLSMKSKLGYAFFRRAGWNATQWLRRVRANGLAAFRYQPPPISSRQWADAIYNANLVELWERLYEEQEQKGRKLSWDLVKTFAFPNLITTDTIAHALDTY